MNMDIFIEHRVIKQRTGIDRLKILLLTLATVLVFFIVLTVGLILPAFFFIIFALDIGVIYGWWYLVTSFGIEYEYALTNGELDIDKIIAKRRRKRLITVNLKDAEVIAPVASPDHRREFENPNIKTSIDASSSPSSPSAYFIVVNHKKTGYTRVIFEPNDKIIEGARIAAPRKFFDK